MFVPLGVGVTFPALTVGAVSEGKGPGKGKGKAYWQEQDYDRYYVRPQLLQPTPS